MNSNHTSIPLFFDHRNFSQAEMEIANYISNNLMQLHSNIDSLAAAVKLAEYAYAERRKSESMSEERRQYQAWWLIAAGHGAIILQSAYMVMQAISGKLLYRCPPLSKSINHSSKKAAFSKFHSCFPNIDCVRDDVAHGGELSSTPEDSSVNASRHSTDEIANEAGIPIYISGSFMNGEYMCTVRGKVVSYRPDQNAVTSYADIVHMMSDAFRASPLVI